MSYELHQILTRADDTGWREALQWAGAFIAGFASAQTRRSYQRDLHCWFGFCAAHDLHPTRMFAAHTSSCTYATSNSSYPGRPTQRCTGASPHSAHGSPGSRTRRSSRATRRHACAGPHAIPARSPGSTATSSPTYWPPPKTTAATVTPWSACSLRTGCGYRRPAVPTSPTWVAGANSPPCRCSAKPTSPRSSCSIHAPTRRSIRPSPAGRTRAGSSA